MTYPRLSRAGVAALRAEGPLQLPDADLRPRVGIVHLGIGAFHRAHQATYAEDAMALDGDDRWGICGVTQRTRTVVDHLVPQDCLYGVLARDAEQMQLRIVGAVREVVSAADDPDVVARRLEADDVHLVTVTVTEKGYRRRADGGLDLSDPAVRADLAGAPARTAVGQLVGGFQRRMHRGSGGLTVISCDNLPANGSVLERLVSEFCAMIPGSRGEDLRRWVATQVTFPSSMVDRIVPATTAEDREIAQSLCGMRDEGLVVAEPYHQWVIEDRFAGPRPPWERAGAVLVDDVGPYEAAKLRLVNATHSLLAYAGILAGHRTIADAATDPALAEVAERYLAEDASPTLSAPPALDLVALRAGVLRRFANPALRHTTAQVGADGSQKLPLRLLGVIRERMAQGHLPESAATAVAAWMLCVARSASEPERYPLRDPMLDRLHAAAAGSVEDLATRMLAVGEVFDSELAGSAALADLVGDHVRRLDRTYPG